MQGKFRRPGEGGRILRVTTTASLLFGGPLGSLRYVACALKSLGGGAITPRRTGSRGVIAAARETRNLALATGEREIAETAAECIGLHESGDPRRRQ